MPHPCPEDGVRGAGAGDGGGWAGGDGRLGAAARLRAVLRVPAEGRHTRGGVEFGMFRSLDSRFGRIVDVWLGLCRKTRCGGGLATDLPCGRLRAFPTPLPAAPPPFLNPVLTLSIPRLSAVVDGATIYDQYLTII